MKTTVLVKPAGGGQVKLMVTLQDNECSYCETALSPMSDLGQALTAIYRRAGAWMRVRGQESIAFAFEGLSCEISEAAVTAHWPMRGALCMARSPYASKAPLAAVGMAVQEALNSVLASADEKEIG